MSVSTLMVLQSCTNLLLNNIGEPCINDKEQIKALAKAARVDPFVPRSVKIKTDDKDQTVEGGEDDQKQADDLSDDSDCE